MISDDKNLLADVSKNGEASAANDSRKEKMQRMLRWLAQHGATFPAIKIRNMENGEREAYADAQVKAGALVLHLPRSLMLTVEAAKASEIGQTITAHNPEVSYHGYLAAYLLDIKRNGGFWSPYIDVLPQVFPEHPIFFSESELEYLKGSYALRVVRRNKQWLEREFRELQSCLPPEKMFSPDEHAWALVNVLTRTYSVRFSGQRSHAMIPLADMPNHAVKPNLLWEPEAARGFFHTAARDIEAGVPLTISYWKECNALTFAVYGFCLETNPYDVAEIHLPSLPQDHPDFEAAKEMGATRDGMRVFKVPVDLDDKRTQILFSYLRLSIQADYSGAESDRLGYGISLVSPLHKSEHAALDVLASACRRRLQQFDTSIWEDEEMLKNGSLPLKLRFMIQVRHGEKVILKRYLDMAEAMLSAP